MKIMIYKLFCTLMVLIPLTCISMKIELKNEKIDLCVQIYDKSTNQLLKNAKVNYVKGYVSNNIKSIPMTYDSVSKCNSYEGFISYTHEINRITIEVEGYLPAIVMVNPKKMIYRIGVVRDIYTYHKENNEYILPKAIVVNWLTNVQDIRQKKEDFHNLLDKLELKIDTIITNLDKENKLPGIVLISKTPFNIYSDKRLKKLREFGGMQWVGMIGEDGRIYTNKFFITSPKDITKKEFKKLSKQIGLKINKFKKIEKDNCVEVIADASIGIGIINKLIELKELDVLTEIRSININLVSAHNNLK